MVIDRLPSEYQEVEYLESTGEEWIDSGVIPDRHLSFHCKFNVYAANSPGFGNVFGSRETSSVKEYQVCAYQKGIISVGARNSQIGFYPNVINTIDFDGNSTATVNGIQTQLSAFDEVYDGSIYLFAIRHGDSVRQQQSGRIYELSFGNVANLIPCYRLSDQEPGMYDTVTKQFFTNSGTGTFLVGNDVHHSNLNLMESRRRILLNTPHIKSLSGNALSFKTDVPFEMKECKVHFDPVQDLHGYDHPWPAGGGKNLIDYLSCVGVGARNGTDSVYGDNTSISGTELTINQAYGNNGGILKGVGTFPLSTGEYVTISGKATLTGTSKLVIGISNYDGGGTNNIDINVTIINGRFSVKLNAKSDYAKTGIFLQPQGLNSTVVVSEVMVALGQTEQPYSPYSNVCPITGWDGVSVTACGKNLAYISESNLHDSQRCNLEYSDVGVVLTATGTYARARYVTNVEKGKTYTVSLYASSTGDYNYIYLNDNAGSWLTQYGKLNVNSSREFFTKTFIALTDVFTIGFYCTAESKTGIMIIDNIQLEEGSTATSYEPYQGESYDIDFPQSAGTVYGGTIDMLDWTLTVDMAMVDLGTLNWQYRGDIGTGIFSSRSITDYRYAANNCEAVCANYEYIGITGGVTGVKIGDKLMAFYSRSDDSSSNRLIYVRDTAYTDAASFKSAMSGVQLVYELATPQTYQLTPETIRTLRGLNNVFSNANGNIDVSFWSH